MDETEQRQAAGITPEEAASILDDDARLIREKIKAGKPLTVRERNSFQSIVAGGNAASATCAKNQVELAAILGVDRSTIQRARKRPNNPGVMPDGRLDVNAWREFLKATGRYDDGSDSLTSKKELNLDLKNEKLAAETEILKRNWRPKDEIERLGAELGHAIRKIVATLHLCAPQVVGVSVAEAEKILKEKEDEVMQQLQLLADALENDSPQNAPAA